MKIQGKTFWNVLEITGLFLKSRSTLLAGLLLVLFLGTASPALSADQPGELSVIEQRVVHSLGNLRGWIKQTEDKLRKKRYWFFGASPISQKEFAAAKDKLIEMAQIPVTQGFITSKKITTSYYQAGKGPTVVLLHGAGGGGIAWFRLFQPLGKHYRVIAPDVVGYGESSKPDAIYSRLYFSQWLGDFLEALGEEEVILVGSSQGGAIALQYTLEHPQRVKKLILVGSAGFGKLDISYSGSGLINFAKANIYPNKKNTRKRLPKIVSDVKQFPEALLTYHVAIAHSGSWRVFWQGRGDVVKPYAKGALRGLKQPKLLVWGRQDETWPLAHAYKAASELSGAKLVLLDNSKHLPYLDQPQALAKEILHFLTPQK